MLAMEHWVATLPFVALAILVCLVIFTYYRYIRSPHTKLIRPLVEEFLIKHASDITPNRGEYVIAFYTSKINKMRAFAPYIHKGLLRNERVIYVYPDDEDMVVRARLKEHGIDAEMYEKEGSLLLMTLSRVFLPNGVFDKDALIRFWTELKSDTLKRGYGHERVLIDLGDLSFLGAELEKYFDYLKDAQMHKLDKSIIQLSAVNAEKLSRQHVHKLKLCSTKSINLLFKRTDAFSKILGLDHWQMVGRKILFEFDPASNYEKVVHEFITEAVANIEPIVVFTRRSSAIHSSLGEQKAVSFFCLTQRVSVPRELSEREMLLPSSDTCLMLNVFDKILKAYPEDVINIVFDNLSDLVLSIGFEKTYHFMRRAAEMLASPRVTAIFLVNPFAHGPEVASSLRGLFGNQISFGKDGIQAVKLSETEGTARIEKISAKK
jgi:hypothetical protein